jgi:hypothetical protein
MALVEGMDGSKFFPLVQQPRNNKRFRVEH